MADCRGLSRKGAVTRVRLTVLTLIPLLTASACAGSSSLATPATTPSRPTTTDAPTSTSPEAPLMREVNFDPPYLFLPTRLPSGMDLCAPPAGQSAHFCDDQGVRSVAVLLHEFSPSQTTGGVPVSGWARASWLELGDSLTLAIPVEGVMLLTLTSTGVAQSQLVDVARSIPLVVDDSPIFRIDAGDPLNLFDVSDGVAASILAIDLSEVYRGSSGWVPRTNTDNLRLLVDSAPSLLTYAATMRYPLALTDLPVPAVGGLGTGSQENVSRISWSQRGLVWTLQSNQSLDLTILVKSAIDIIDSL